MKWTYVVDKLMTGQELLNWLNNDDEYSEFTRHIDKSKIELECHYSILIRYSSNGQWKYTLERFD